MARYTDVPSIVQVIGNIYNDNSLLDKEEYSFNTEDFPDEFHRIVFGSIFNLHSMGVEKVTPMSIEDYLQERPEKLAKYRSGGGEQYLKKISESAERATFPYYYGRMKKMTLLRMYHQMTGMDLSSIYDDTNILDVKKKQIQEDYLDNTTVQEIAERIDIKIRAIREKFAEELEGDEISSMGDDILEMLEERRKHPDVGVPLYGDLYNTVTRGARLTKFYLRSAPVNTGKALPNDMLIPTPEGKRRVGDVRPGDYLYGQDGKPTKVLQIHPQSLPKKEWKVKFIDGREIVCSGDHLWEYWYKSRGAKHSFRVETTEQIYKRTLKLKNGFKNSDGKGYRFYVPICEPVEGRSKNLYPPPYAMGAILGDGSLRYNDRNKALLFSSADSEVPERVAKELGVKEAYKINSNNYTWTFHNEKGGNLWTEQAMVNYPELWNALSEDKFIPREYLEASLEQRIALMQGLMDTDGHIDPRLGTISFTTISSRLKDDVVELCQSLGMSATITLDKRVEKYTTGVCYQINIQGKKEFKPSLFYLKRKKNIAEAYVNNGKKQEYKNRLSIVDIEELDSFSEMTCFTVDNPRALFLAQGYVVTHNTRSMIADACMIGCGEVYDVRLGKWIKTSPAQPTMYIATEQERAEVQMMCLAFLTGIPESRISLNECDEEEWQRIKYAADLLKSGKLFFTEKMDFSLSEMENIVKKSVKDFDVAYIFLDYIHSSIKILSEITSSTGIKGMREDNILFMLSAKLKEICLREKVFIMSATQLNGDYKTAKKYDQNLLRGAKAIADKADLCSHLIPVDESDLEALKPALEKGLYDTPRIKHAIYKNRGPHKDILLWCKSDLGTCRITPMFATTYDYELVDIPELKIKVVENE